MVLNLTGTLFVPLSGATQAIFNNSIKKGDVLMIQDFIIGTSSIVDFSGQYVVDSVSTTDTSINLDITNNPTIVSYINTNGATTLNPILANKPYLSLNKGSKYRITRVSSDDTSSFSNRYLVEKH